MSEIENLHENLKFDGVWIDMNEPSNFATDKNNLASETNKNRYFNCTESINYPNFLPKRYQTDRNVQDSRIFDNTICMDNLHEIDGQQVQHFDVHSMYGFSESIATIEATRKVTHDRSLSVSRSTFIGSQKYSAFKNGCPSAQNCLFGLVLSNNF